MSASGACAARSLAGPVTAEFSTINLGLGAHSIFGMYSGSAEFQSSSSKKITVTVTPSP
jgi:ribosomal protein L27